MMAVIETKYSVGDAVWHASTITTAKQHPCPDCKGERKWKVTSPAGGEYEIGCPRCAARFMSDSGLSLTYTAHVPSVKLMHIGSVQHNSAVDSWDSGNRYMCRETGIGSGNVYDEARLFETEEVALKAAEAMAAKENATQEWIVKLYDKSLEISDYQLDSAAMKLAKDTKSRASSMLWNLIDLFSKIEKAADKDEILEAVDDYKKYDWDRDRGKIAPPVNADEIPA